MKGPDLAPVLAASVAYVQNAKRLRNLYSADVTDWIESIPMSTSIQKTDTEKPAPIVRAAPPELGIPIEQLISRVQKVREVQARVMTEGQHYGTVPGTDKKCLFKPGAELLGLTFQLDPQFSVVERWDGQHVEAVVTCTLFNAPTGTRLGSGVGSCSTKESRYAWRKGERTCPQCGKPAIIRGKEEYGGGWLCFRKKDGCNAKFKAGDKAIEGQSVGRVANEDIADQYNTVRKMACKRAHVAAILFVTCASEIFTQDLEDSVADQPSASHGDVYPDEDPEAAPKANPEFDAVMKLIQGIDKEIAAARTVTREDLDRWRGIFGSKAQPSEQVGKRIRAFFDDISPSQRTELGKLSNRVERQLKRYEGIVPAAVAPEHEPGDDTGEEPF